MTFKWYYKEKQLVSLAGQGLQAQKQVNYIFMAAQYRRQFSAHFYVNFYNIYHKINSSNFTFTAAKIAVTISQNISMKFQKSFHPITLIFSLPNQLPNLFAHCHKKTYSNLHIYSSSIHRYFHWKLKNPFTSLSFDIYQTILHSNFSSKIENKKQKTFCSAACACRAWRGERGAKSNNNGTRNSLFTSIKLCALQLHWQYLQRFSLRTGNSMPNPQRGKIH